MRVDSFGSMSGRPESGFARWAESDRRRLLRPKSETHEVATGSVPQEGTVIADRVESAGGWGGIRTHETVARLPVFKTGAFNRSATHPDRFLHVAFGMRLTSRRERLACVAQRFARHKD
jgi:hypothetical protein